MTQGPSRTLKIAMVAGVVALLITAQQLGLLHQFADPERARQTLVGLGAWGYVAFVVAYALLQPFGVPGTVFIMVAPLIWPWPVAFALSMTGTMAASVVGFSFARFVARDWFAARIPPRIARYNEALARRGFLTVFWLRLVIWMPPWLHAFFGLSSVPFATHFWGSLAGYLLPLFLVSYFGQRIFDLMRQAPLSLWVGLGVALALTAALVWAWRRCSHARRMEATVG